MRNREINQDRLLGALDELKSKIIECESFRLKLQALERAHSSCPGNVDELVETRTVSERIINKQLRHEIEQRRALEEELFRNKQFLENVVNGIAEQICVISNDFKILWANKTFLEHFKCDAEQVIGHFCYAVTHHRDSPCQPPNDLCPLSSVLETGKPVTTVHLHRGKDGDFYSEVSAYPIKDKDGQVVEFVHIARDIVGPRKAGLL